ncbi:MAG: histidine phosphatase family protein [Candidatus Dadabacteria bacterium]|nr:histidine phosphatase family protein [Candidatus Dadabacteria bacterium]NIQ14019.1 histidine phosphatase family protein [Candidatus Dadabacteria bacterium]
MSKKIFIYRHAKSDWNAEYSDDHERPLATKGVRSAKLMGKLLAKSNQVPELVITSSALRAKNTLDTSMKEGKWKSEMKIDKNLYYGSFIEIFESLNEITDKYNSIMLVSHEPKCSSLCSYLIGGGDIVFPTAAMARIDYNIESWNKITPGSGMLRWLLQPSFFLK